LFDFIRYTQSSGPQMSVLENVIIALWMPRNWPRGVARVEGNAQGGVIDQGIVEQSGQEQRVEIEER
jgi:hypothetical protein